MTSFRKIGRFAVLATCLATVADAKVLKTSFRSLLIPEHHEPHALKFMSAAAHKPDPNVPLDNAVLKVVATVHAGNGQTFENVLVDTGSAILWVGKEEPYAPGPHSKEFGEFSIGYGVGGARGLAYTDQVTIGEATVKSQIIGAANDTSGFQNVLPIDGLLGLGPADSNGGQIIGYNSTPTFVESLVAEGSIDEPIFGIHINGLNFKNGQQVSEGEITFGGVDESKIQGRITWLSQIPPVNFRWAFNVSGLSWGTLPVATGTMPGRTDTGVLGIGVPFDSLFSILHTVPGATIVPNGPLNGFLAFPANATAASLPPLSLSLGNDVFNLQPSQYLVPPSLYSSLNYTSGNLVYSWIASAGQGSFMLGQKWLEGIYTAYDMKSKRIGFAHLK